MVKLLEHVRIASRGSQLALWQSEKVRDELGRSHAGVSVDITVIRTTGDRILDVPLARIGDRGLFTKEIDDALLRDDADIAVHSLKDIPTRLPEGLDIVAISPREDPRDVLITRKGVPARLEGIPAGSRIGTSSLRRRSQLRSVRPDLDVVDLRGNLNTRLARLDAGDYDAIILAAAGVVRLGWADRISQILTTDLWLPAVGQGALAVVARADRTDVAAMLEPLHHVATAQAVLAERAFLRELEGGCQVPIGALATLQDDRLTLDGLVADLDGTTILRASQEGDSSRPEVVGKSLASTLVERGAADILRAIRDAVDAPRVPGP